MSGLRVNRELTSRRFGGEREGGEEAELREGHPWRRPEWTAVRGNVKKWQLADPSGPSARP
jgi:hypothetical protein